VFSLDKTESFKASKLRKQGVILSGKIEALRLRASKLSKQGVIVNLYIKKRWRAQKGKYIYIFQTYFIKMFRTSTSQ
jgi:hypothetical protein